ncbi:hypothetical protein As57867_006766, partial [Aphanomyces stellatus]
MTDKTAEKSIGECQAILRLEPAVVAHSLYSGPNDSALLNALIASHAVERKMASYKHQGKPSNYRDYLDTSNLSQVGLKCPRAILEAITTSSEDEVLMAVASLDLYLCNRAPDLYTNYEAIEVLLGEAATLWETRLTDRSLIGVVKKLMATLRGYTLPFPIVEALDKLHFIISNNSIDSICD